MVNNKIKLISVLIGFSLSSYVNAGCCSAVVVTAAPTVELTLHTGFTTTTSSIVSAIEGSAVMIVKAVESSSAKEISATTSSAESQTVALQTAIKEQTATLIENQMKFQFGDVAMVDTSSGKKILTSGSPYSCPDSNRALALRKANAISASINEQALKIAKDRNNNIVDGKRFNSGTIGEVAITKDKDDAFDLSLLSKSSLSDDEIEFVQKAINYQTNPEPLPTFDKIDDDAYHYDITRKRFNGRISVLQAALSRQLQAKAKTVVTPEGQKISQFEAWQLDVDRRYKNENNNNNQQRVTVNGTLRESNELGSIQANLQIEMLKTLGSIERLLVVIANKDIQDERTKLSEVISANRKRQVKSLN